MHEMIATHSCRSTCASATFVLAQSAPYVPVSAPVQCRCDMTVRDMTTTYRILAGFPSVWHYTGVTAEKTTLTLVLADICYLNTALPGTNHMTNMSASSPPTCTTSTMITSSKVMWKSLSTEQKHDLVSLGAGCLAGVVLRDD